jgi:recombination protein RecR
MLPEPINNLVTSIASLPGIGKKGATRIVLDYLNSDKVIQDNILRSFIDVRRNTTICPICSYISQDNQPCVICQNRSRTDNQIMIVHSPFDIISIEENRVYNGKYHVLNNLISPLDNQMVNTTTIPELELRITNFIRHNPADKLELIYFIKHSFSALTTFTYIQDFINNLNSNRVTIVKLATGLPSNFNIQNIDQESLKVAYENRK